MTRIRFLAALLIIWSVAAGCSTPNAAVPDEPATAPRTQPAVDTSGLYIKRFDAPEQASSEVAFVFLHGGPGSNAFLFEATTAEPLSERGSVLVYERPGSGRSEPGAISDFRFEAAVAQLHQLLSELEPGTQPILIGHSFGGALALRYLADHPETGAAAVLVDAPLNYPAMLSSILGACRQRYEQTRKADMIGYLDQIEAFDPASMEYAQGAFFHGIGCGLYFPSSPTPEAFALVSRAMESPDAALLTAGTAEPFEGFYANEAYTTLDHSEALKAVADHVFVLYGDEDPLISATDRAFLADALPAERVVVIPGASHNVFVDQQQAFLDALDGWFGASP